MLPVFSLSNAASFDCTVGFSIIANREESLTSSSNRQIISRPYERAQRRGSRKKAQINTAVLFLKKCDNIHIPERSGCRGDIYHICNWVLVWGKLSLFAHQNCANTDCGVGFDRKGREKMGLRLDKIQVFDCIQTQGKKINANICIYPHILT